MSEASPARRGGITHPIAILAMLTTLNFLNYVDRYLVSAVAPKFQEELHLSNFVVGLVNSAFMVGYFATSPLFGVIGDRPSSGRPIRTWLISMGVAVWSLATALSGLAKSGLTMIAARIGVGVGEASYATLAPTIIDDLAPEGRSNRWLAVFYLAIPVGSALGFLLGGQLEHLYGWRAAFFIAGGPGLLLALIALLVREPRRKESEKQERLTPREGFSQLWRAPLFVVTTAGYCAYTFALGGFAAWAPKFLYATHKMALAEADFGFGVVAVLAGFLGTFGGAWIADRGLPKDASEEQRIRRYLRFSGWAAALAVPAAIACIVASSPRGFFASIFVCETLLFASTSPISVVTLGAVPKSLRATAMATSIFAIHAFGDLLSPPLVGLIADHAPMRTALAILPAAIGLAALLWIGGARAALRRV